MWSLWPGGKKSRFLASPMCCCAGQCGPGEKQQPLRLCLLVKWSTFVDRAAKAKTNHVHSSPGLTGEESAELPSAVLPGLCKFLPETAESPASLGLAFFLCRFLSQASSLQNLPFPLFQNWLGIVSESAKQSGCWQIRKGGILRVNFQPL